MRADNPGLAWGALLAILAGIACGDLGGAGGKDRCHKPADCNPGYGCVESVCQKWVEVPGVVSTEPFTETKDFLVNLVSSGNNQILLQYDADSAGVPIRASFGRDNPGQLSKQGSGLSISPGAFDNAPGLYVLHIEVGSGVTVRQVSVAPCPDDFLDDLRNCGQCGHVCAAPPGLHSPPVCNAGVCEWSAKIQPFLSALYVRPAPNTTEDPICDVLPDQPVFFDCQVVGELVSNVNLPNSSDVWDHVPALGGYVADLLLATGVNGMFAPACP